MEQYRCVKSFTLYFCDSDGSCTDETMTIEVGEIFKVGNKYPCSHNIAGNDECIHLEADNGDWIEILPDTLAEYFVKEGPDNGNNKSEIVS